MGKLHRMRVPLHHEGKHILAIVFLALAVTIVPIWVWVWPLAPAVPIVITSVCAVLYLALVNFFRSPKRCFTGDRADAVVSSADGKVVVIERVYEPECLKCECMQVSVFMNIFQVHANWFPVDGEVIYVNHHGGRFMAAYLPKSSTENERSTVLIKTDKGQMVLMRQIAGAVARRIVTYAEPGNEASIEDHLGFIKFGSRVDLYLPLDTELLVSLGDTVKGGVSLIGRLSGIPQTDINSNT